MSTNPTDALAPESSTISLTEAAAVLRSRWRIVVGATFAGAAIGVAIALLLPPIYTARGLVLPPTQPQSTAAAALSSLGSLGSLGGVSGLRSPADQFVALMQSATVGHRLVDRFKLMETFDVPFKDDAYRLLLRSTRMSVGKRDGLITIEVDSKSPKLAADLANAYVEALRELLSSIAVTEAQQRRVFFEARLKETSDKLSKAQGDLQASGISPGTIKSDPRSAADNYARLKAELTAATVRLEGLRQMMVDAAPEVQQQLALMSALRRQLDQLESPTPSNDGGSRRDYVSLYREFKYQETLFELYARQYEVARADESRDGVLLQVVDAAQPPDRKSKPSRTMITVFSTALFGLAGLAFVLIHHSIRRRTRSA